MKIEEGDASMIAAAGYLAGQGYLGSSVLGTERASIVGANHVVVPSNLRLPFSRGDI